jgi:hypothetical protein
MNQYIYASKEETIKNLKSFIDTSSELDAKDGLEFFKILYYNIEYFLDEDNLLNIICEKWKNFKHNFEFIDSNITNEINIVLFSQDVKELKSMLHNKYAVRRLINLSDKPKYKLLALEHKIDFEYENSVNQEFYDEYLSAYNEYQELLNKFDETDIIYENHYIKNIENDLLKGLKQIRDKIEDNLTGIKELSSSKTFNFKNILDMRQLTNNIEYFYYDLCLPLYHEDNLNISGEYNVKEYYEILDYIKKIKKETIKLKEEIDLLPEIGDQYMKAKEHFESIVE